MNKYILKNNNLIKDKEALISINERGFLYGDGLFETCHIFNQRIINFNNHIQRIKIGLDTLKIKTDLDNLEKNCYRLIKKNQIKNGLLRISISRGIGSIGYLPKNNCKPLTIIQTSKITQTPSKIILGISSIKAPSIPFKSTNSIPYILAKIEAKQRNLFDVIMLDEKNNICETSSANIFWIKNKKIFTPSDECNIIKGCVRSHLLNLKQLKINQVKTKISHLENADAILITNSRFLIKSVDELVIIKNNIKFKKNFNKKITLGIEKLVKDSLHKTCQNIKK